MNIITKYSKKRNKHYFKFEGSKRYYYSIGSKVSKSKAYTRCKKAMLHQMNLNDCINACKDGVLKW